jgi:hypothetical protein
LTLIFLCCNIISCIIKNPCFFLLTTSYERGERAKAEGVFQEVEDLILDVKEVVEGALHGCCREKDARRNRSSGRTG